MCFDAHEGTAEASPFGITAADESLMVYSKKGSYFFLGNNL